MPPRELRSFPSVGVDFGLGIREVVQVQNPAAGSDWTYTVPAGYYRRLLAGNSVFTTSGVAGTRLAGYQITDGTNVIQFVQESTAIGATLAPNITFMRAGGTQFAGSTSAGFVLPVFDSFLQPGFTFGSKTNSQQAADQYSAIFLWFECYEIGPSGTPTLMHPATLQEIYSTFEPERDSAQRARTHTTPQGG